MQSLDYWRLCEELTIVEAALLIVGKDPSGDFANVESWEIERPHGYDAAKAALVGALHQGTIDGKIFAEQWGNLHPSSPEIPGTVDVLRSRVEVVSLRKWLRGRGIRTGFFFPEGTNDPDYLNPHEPHYSPKLAAAIRAWEAVVSESALVSGTSPKQAILKWLRQNAAQFELTIDDGSPNKQGIEEVAKIANWDQKGGAPRTPSGKPPTP